MRTICSCLAILLIAVCALHASPNGRGYGSGTEKTPGNEKSKDAEETVKRPHIIVILADDLGWNDVSFHGSNQIPTPNIDALAYNGVILNNHYVSALCTPSRAALMTGKYPIHTGTQHSVILEPEPRGLPLNEKLLPEHLRAAGYKTHAIGKWHLGYHRKEYTPMYRGFDTHFGYWNGLQDYYTHQVEATFEGYRGFDMRRNMSVAWDTAGKYSTDLFTEEAVRLIESHDDRSPMFMYLAHLAPHTGNQYAPFQAPDEEVAKFAHIDDPERRIYAAMVSKLDQSVGEVVAALRRRDMLGNSIVLFMSDNGAPTFGIHSNRGSNYPMRGIKDSPWEGGVRGVAAMWSPLIEETNRVSDQLMYITDWLPTFYSAAGLDPKDLGDIDGIDLWSALRKNRVSPRTEFVVNVDDISNYAAIRKGDFKYVIGMTDTGDGWSGESGRPELGNEMVGVPPPYDPEMILRSRVGVALAGAITASQVERLGRVREGKIRLGGRTAKMLTTSEITRMRTAAELRCNVAENDKVACNPLSSPCLFNVKEDPCEMVNLAKKRPLVLATLEDALMKYRLNAVPAANVETDPRADPSRWNGTWVNWKESDPMRYSRSLVSPKSERLSGPAIALIAVCIGLVIVGMLVLVAIKRCQDSRVESNPEHGTFCKVPEEHVDPTIELRNETVSSSDRALVMGPQPTPRQIVTPRRSDDSTRSSFQNLTRSID